MFVEIAFAFFLCVYSSIAVETECSRVWLNTYSKREFGADAPVNKLQINWIFTCPSEENRPNIIKVFDAYPSRDSALKPRLILNIKDYEKTYYRSDINARISQLPGGWNIDGDRAIVGPHCFNHFAALYNEESRVMTSCLEIHPTWMHDYRRILGSLPIASLIIPGTYNSGSYRSGDEFESIPESFAVAQNCDVWTQLVYGIRYLDINVVYRNGNGFWANHGTICIKRLASILGSVKKFLGLATEEVVIMDFHGFLEGFTNVDVHNQLIQLLDEVFGELAVNFNHKPNGLTPTLNTMVQRGKRIILCYDNSDQVGQHKWLWPPLTKSCVDMQTSNSLFAFFDNKTTQKNSREQQNPNPLWAVSVAIAQPDLTRTILQPCAELRVTTDTVDPSLTAEFPEGQWRHTNIIVTDLFQENNLIDIAIQSNIRKHKHESQVLPKDATKEIKKPIDIVKLNQCSKVWLTVSSLLPLNLYGSNFLGTNLEINWKLNCTSGTESPNLIKVYYPDPTDPMRTEELTIAVNDYTDEYFRTDIIVRMDLALPGGWATGNSVDHGPHCLQYSATLYYDDTLISSECLQIQPTWMHDHRTALGNMRIGDLMIPGTRNSGSYKLDDHSITSRDENYALTQDRDIWTQLVHGIRYFDLRVNFFNPSIENISQNGTSFPMSGYSVNHLRMLTIIEDVKRFLTVTTGEIIILDFRRFGADFSTPAVHHDLIQILLVEFRNFIFEFDSETNISGPTLNVMWESKKRLIICYDDSEMLREYNWLWPSVQYALEVRYKPFELLYYLDNWPKVDLNRENSRNPLWGIMAALTPMPTDILYKPRGGYRVLANSVNRGLSVIFKNKWCQEANIVASDFFLGNSLIDISITCNKLKASAGGKK